MMPIFNKYDKSPAKYAGARGIVLMLTMIVLVILAILGYTLSSRVAAQRHRYNYIIDYTCACYARDSALKYVLSNIDDINNIKLISRPNEPDFSDLFAMSDADYHKLLDNWAADIIKRKLEKEKEDQSWRTSFDSNQRDLNDLGFHRDINSSYFSDTNFGWPRDSNSKDTNQSHIGADTNIAGPNIAALTGSEPNWDGLEANLTDPNLLTVPGPYGPEWPYIAEPVEFEIDDCNVKIAIEDENAKFPAGWAILEDEKYKRESGASVGVFFEWMGFDSDRIDKLKKQFSEVRDIKPFKIEFQAIATKVLNKNAASRPPKGNRPAKQQTPTYNNVTLSPAQQIAKQARDFSCLFHNSAIDTDTLAGPTIISDKRKESALKYMSLWGTTQVNVNTAPRQVLEAAFTFGGQAPRIADEIIKKRKKTPFENIDQLKSELLSYADSIEKCKPFINTASTVFTIHVTATRGIAKASAVVVIVQADGKFQQVAILSG